MIGHVRLSADGRTVAYDVDVVVLTGSASGALGRVHVKDRRTGTTHRVDPDTEARSVLAQLTDDGRRVLRPHRAGRARGRYGGRRRHHRPSGAHRPVATAGTALPGAVARHGRAVVFTSTADDLVPDGTNGVADALVRHAVTNPMISALFAS